MADSPILPGSHSRPLGQDGGWSREWFGYFRSLQTFVTATTTNEAGLAAALTRIVALEDGTAGGVTSFRGRSGAVVPLVGDYSAWFQPLDATLTTLADTDLSAIADGDLLAWDAASETFVATPQTPGGAPYFIASGDTFTVPEFSQVLFSMPIDAEGFIDVSGYLVGVD
jgi:hypothetical protein